VCVSICVCYHIYQTLVTHPTSYWTLSSELFRETLNSVIIHEGTETLKSKQSHNAHPSLVTELRSEIRASWSKSPAFLTSVQNTVIQVWNLGPEILYFASCIRQSSDRSPWQCDLLSVSFNNNSTYSKMLVWRVNGKYMGSSWQNAWHTLIIN
jgi:hypothetical protein